MRTEELIGGMAAELLPVRRLPRPGVQAMLWAGGALGVVALAVLLHGPRPDLATHLAQPLEAAQLAASVATGLAAALAAAMLARPDRPWRWAWLPVPPLLAWVSLLGLGCLADFSRLGDAAFRPWLSWGCIRFVLLLGAPLLAGLLVLLRHAGPVRPTPVLLLSALASAALCSAGLSLFHHLDAAVEVLASHGLAAGLLVTAGRLLGRPLLLRAPASR